MVAKALVLTGYGLNSEEETAFAFETVGFKTQIRHINDLAENPHELNDTQVLCVPGGFSYGDDTGSGNAFAQKMRLTLGDHLKKFVERDTLTLGICNGCQIITNLGLVPALNNNIGVRSVAVTHNLTARYQCRWVDVAVQSSQSPWLVGITQMHIPVAHGEGRFMMDDQTLTSLRKNNHIALRYVKPSPFPPVGGQGGEWIVAAGEFPFNPNGSLDDIAGISDSSGRILALMPHPERGMFTWQRDDFAQVKDFAKRTGSQLPEASDGLELFKNSRIYFS